MRRSTLAATVAAAFVVLAGVVPSFAASAANSQNGTDSSNANATLSAPKSASQVPATNMPMGTTTGATPTQDGSTMMNGGAMSTNGTMGNGGAMTAAPKQ